MIGWWEPTRQLGCRKLNPAITDTTIDANVRLNVLKLEEPIIFICKEIETQLSWWCSYRLSFPEDDVIRLPGVLDSSTVEPCNVSSRMLRALHFPANLSAASRSLTVPPETCRTMTKTGQCQVCVCLCLCLKVCVCTCDLVAVQQGFGRGRT